MYYFLSSRSWPSPDPACRRHEFIRPNTSDINGMMTRWGENQIVLRSPYLLWAPFPDIASLTCRRLTVFSPTAEEVIPGFYVDISPHLLSSWLPPPNSLSRHHLTYPSTLYGCTHICEEIGHQSPVLIYAIWWREKFPRSPIRCRTNDFFFNIATNLHHASLDDFT